MFIIQNVCTAKYQVGLFTLVNRVKDETNDNWKWCLYCKMLLRCQKLSSYSFPKKYI